MFIATKVGAPKEGGGNTLFRHEFFEILIRIANCKYREQGKADSYNASLKLLLEGMINSFNCRPWQEFREEELWTTKINAMLEANKSGLNEVYKYLFPKFGDKSEYFRKCLDLMSRHPLISLPDKETRFCFGMSKMTVKDEVGNHDEYDKLRFVEFLEFLGRCASAKYIENQSIDLHEKLEEFIKLIMTIFNLKFKNPKVEVEDDNTSDESVVDVNSDDENIGALDSDRMLF